MTNTKRLIKFLREIAVYLKMMRRAGWITKEIEEDGKAKLKQIREILEKQAQPDEELVKEIEQIFLEHNMSIPPSEEIVGKLVKYKPVLSAIGVNMLRSLLQSRQQTKPVVTRGEIDELCETLETIINPEDPTDMDRYMKQYIKDWLKSKGFEEEEKP